MKKSTTLLDLIVSTVYSLNSFPFFSKKGGDNNVEKNNWTNVSFGGRDPPDFDRDWDRDSLEPHSGTPDRNPAAPRSLAWSIDGGIGRVLIPPS